MVERIAQSHVSQFSGDVFRLTYLPIPLAPATSEQILTRNSSEYEKPEGDVLYLRRRHTRNIKYKQQLYFSNRILTEPRSVPGDVHSTEK